MLSGTSMDAVDCVLLDFSDDRLRIVDFLCEEIDVSLKTRLLQLVANKGIDLRELGNTDIQVARLFANTVNRLLEKNHLNARSVAAIGSHGQTIWHEPPQSAAQFPFSMQIGDPSTIAELTGITVIADFRRKDMAAGGQGAPIVPVLHQEIFHNPRSDRIILNLGGIANITFLPRNNAPPLGLDTGPASVLMDAWINEHLHHEFDDQGAWALSGKIDAPLLEGLLDEEYFGLPGPKSTGREFLNLQWLRRKLGKKNLPPQDVQATLLEFTAETVSREILKLIAGGEIITCGGGARNTALLDRLRQKLPGFSVITSTDLGVDADCVEAVAFGWLARKTLRREAVDFSAFTGARHPVIAGGIYYSEQ
jgi:anhydro-N-acetylmuramic acid kinase